MDGIASNTTAFDVDIANALLPLLAGTVAALAGLLVIAFVSEILRRGGIAPGVVRRLDRFLPGIATRIAQTTLAVAIAVVGPTAAYASDAPVRDWLSATTTTTTPDATEDRLIERAGVPATTPTSAPPPLVASGGEPSVAIPGTAAVPTDPVEIPMPEARQPIHRLVVVDGDCLWSIAAGQLGLDSTDRAIDEAWRAIYALNRAAIGNDPNLIFPGLTLELPPIDQSPLPAP